MAENISYDPNCLPDLLPIYYKRLFPYSLYYKWLHYGGVPKTYFSHREFSFTLKDDVYLRYQSFSDQQELEKEIQKRCPYKIDIGAIFSHRPKDHKTVKAAAFQALEKELVFDIDMTDYDDVRFCCSGAEICLKCWSLMQFAIKILDRALREDFGFHHILWVYSGRRGVHCWVCDPDVRKRLQQKGRTAVAEYLNIIRGGENMTKKVNLWEGSIHPSIQKAIEIVRDGFEQYAVDKQDFLGSDAKMKKVLALISDDSVRRTVEDDFKHVKTSRERWQVLQDRVKQVTSKGEGRKCACVIEEIMLQYCYPRLDINVSKGLNHLLKSPFCVHPKTGH
ncbi:hypothetical protein NP493_8g07014 [Ridgeia piscesae]|uniref:DNA primase n=1 Tax=Ridgeia piscesae TaxID=27915 RepID=A0AAD9PFE6_RIDPI|nr:hypothetical protein NP493_8g07014 [Ridgeia piscesae]